MIECLPYILYSLQNYETNIDFVSTDTQSQQYLSKRTDHRKNICYSLSKDMSRRLDRFLLRPKNRVATQRSRKTLLYEDSY